MRLSGRRGFRRPPGALPAGNKGAIMSLLPNPAPDPRPGRADLGARWSGLEQPRITGIATFEWNIPQGTTWYSPEWADITQSDSYDWRSPNNQEWWSKRVHPDDMAVLERACLSVIAGFVESIDLTFRLKRNDGSWRWLLQRAQVTEKTPEGAPLIVSGVCLDVTDMHESASGLRGFSSIADFDYHAMLENSPDLFVRLNRDLSPVYVNPVVARYLGRGAGENPFVDTPENLRITGDYLEPLRKGVERAFTEKAVSRESVSFTMSDGSEISGECSIWPEFDNDRNVKYAMVQFRDLTEQRRAEQRASFNEKRLEALYKLTCMENASDAEVLGFVMDSVLQLTHSRSGFFFMPEENGSDRGYLLWSEDHRNFLEPHHMPSNVLPHDLKIQMTDRQGKRCYRSINNGDGVTPLFVVFDGRMRVMRGIIAPGMENGRMVCIAGVCNRDSDYEESDLQQFETFINSAWLILRRRRSLEELREAKETAESANNAKNAFLANISHELRTPLNGVLSMLQLIDASATDEQQREYLRTAQASGKALMRIISDLLDYSCMESGKMPLDTALFESRETLHSALAVFEEEAAAKGVAYTYAIDPAIPDVLVGDEARVRQILFNVVGNALKFTHSGSVTVTCENLSGVSGKAGEKEDGKTGIAVTVEDTGIGIPEDKLAGLFDAFSRVSGTCGKKYSGTGLGLGIVKHLTAMMGGKVSITSGVGAGTTVRCVMTFALPPEVSLKTPVKQREKKEDPARPLDILVAEDDAVGRFALRAFLERRGHHVVCVEDGAQALEAMQVHPFHCVFTDIEMPNVDGLDLVRHIREGTWGDFPPSPEISAQVRKAFPDGTGRGGTDDTHMPVVAVSAHTMIGDKERFLRKGIDHFISKPIIKEELGEALAFVQRRRG